MAFLPITELKTHIRTNVSTAITQGDTTIVQSAIDTAVTEAKGYCSRYRIAQLFDNEDADSSWIADATLLMHVKSIAKWHLIGLGNTNIDYEDAQIRYGQATDWLKLVQSGKVVPPGWPPATPADKSTFFHMKSNPKRRNHFN